MTLDTIPAARAQTGCRHHDIVTLYLRWESLCVCVVTRMPVVVSCVLVSIV